METQCYICPKCGDDHSSAAKCKPKKFRLKPTDYWETPWEIFNALHEYFHFTIDVCASPGNAKLTRYWTETDNALLKSWRKEICFMNPPYSQQGLWLKKAHEESKSNRARVVALLNVSTSSSYWHDHVIDAGADVHFIRGRIKFIVPPGLDIKKNNPRYDSALVVYPPVHRFNPIDLKSSLTISAADKT